MKKTAPNVPKIPEKSKLAADREFFAKANKFLDVKAIFPRSKVDMRKGLTEYQRKIIAKELRAFARLAGGTEKQGPKFLEKDFSPAVRTKAMLDYMKAVGLPRHSRGVLLPGGSKINSRVTIKNGGLHYVAGIREQSQYPLNATTEKTLVKSIQKYKKIINNPENVSFIGTHGGKIPYHGVQAELEGEESTEMLEDMARKIYNKYVVMVQNHEKRENGRFAAHPSKWGMVLISEPR